MNFVCPKPLVWDRIYQTLRTYWQRRGEVGPAPPVPLILGGWVHSNDLDKHQRWCATIEWAREHRCSELIPVLEPEEGYWVQKMSTYDIGPLGGPMYLAWSGESKSKPTAEEYQTAFEKLRARWAYVVGPDLADGTAPFMFAGKKRRNLVVTVEAGLEAPWGTWTAFSQEESKRRTFTEFRKRLNEVIAPHKVDHVTFRERGNDPSGS